MSIGTWVRLPEITPETMAGDFSDSMFSKVREVGRSMADQKSVLLNTHLGLKKLTDWLTVKQTPSDWAQDKINEFCKATGGGAVEVISVNDMVFVFAKPEIEDKGFGETVETYKYEITQKWAVFKKQSLT